LSAKWFWLRELLVQANIDYLLCQGEEEKKEWERGGGGGGHDLARKEGEKEGG